MVNFVSVFIPGLERQQMDDGVAFSIDGPASIAASIGVGLAYALIYAAAVRGVLPERSGRPAWTYAVAAVVVGIAGAAAIGGLYGLVALFAAFAALAWVAYTSDGAVRPDPLGLRGRRVVIAVAVVVGLGLGGAAVYGFLHPFQIGDVDAQRPIEPSKRSLDVPMPWIDNAGLRSVRVLAIEPGVERGAALRLAEVRRSPDNGYGTRAFRPFVADGNLGAEPSLVLRFSRAGCVPGATGRVESVRVRYELAGERTMALPLEPPLTLRC